MTVVCIVAVYAISGYFERHTVNYNSYRPVLYTCLYYPFAAKHLFGIEINDEIARVANGTLPSRQSRTAPPTA